MWLHNTGRVSRTLPTKFDDINRTSAEVVTVLDWKQSLFEFFNERTKRIEAINLGNNLRTSLNGSYN